ncbi:aminopeptidase N [Psittacicella gerlachiana]|uniref:Aminopeptidase N n=1 Tax=Psittacicella gerlachiana TaxID=2028574 RepID=A0A3A1YHI9_9GAMM|nr:aminopeptidase N [Psittacicella gerlachiana]RIY36709.1 aminopeptidase N [Psittacicella gerlachiana]
MTKRTLKRLDYKPLDFTATQVDLQLNLDLPVSRVQSKIKVKRLNTEATSFVLDGQKLNLLAVKINGQDWSAYVLEDLEGVDGFQNLKIDVSSLSEPQEFTLEIENEFNLEENLSMSGIYLSDKVIVSQCEAQGFRRITFYFDRPDCLAVFTTYLETNDSYEYLLANGNLLESGSLNNGRKFAKWHDPFPKPSYLFACVAGNFEVLDDYFITKSGRKVKLRLFAEYGRLEQIRFAMEAVKRAMKWDEDRFGLEYDLDIFMVVGVAYFNAGAMENKGLNIFNDELLVGCKDTVTDDSLFSIDSVIAHEYFHNWTGDRVTCRDWFQLTLKEGLTVFRDQEYSSDTVNRTMKRIDDAEEIQAYQFNEDKSPLSHPIRPDEVESQDNFYTSTVYEKGAEVIRLLHTLIGEEKFQQGMKLYFERHDGKAVTCEDFVEAMADASGYNLDHFRLWYSQSGTPEVKVTSEYDPQTKVQKVTFVQETAPTFDQQEKQPLTLALKTHFLTPEGQTLTNLVDLQGKAIPELLVFETKELVVEIANQEQELIVVTNLDFSSPVRVIQQTTSSQLATVAAHCQNLYGKYFALKEYYNSIFRLNEENFVRNSQAQLEVDEHFATIYKNLFALALEDASFTSAVLRFHNVSNAITSANKAVNPLVYAQIDKAIKTKLYQDYKVQLEGIYAQLPFRTWEYNSLHFGERALRDQLLSLLTISQENQELVEQLYTQASCYNDKHAVIKAIINNDLSALDYLVDKFALEYQDTASCLDELLTLRLKNAKSVAQVEALLANAKQFSITKPNSLYTLIRGLRLNLNLFFTKEGIEYIKELIIKVDKNNPGVSPYLCRSFANYDLYLDPFRQMVIDALEDLITNHTFSRNATEILNKAFEAQKNNCQVRE